MGYFFSDLCKFFLVYFINPMSANVRKNADAVGGSRVSELAEGLGAARCIIDNFPALGTLA